MKKRKPITKKSQLIDEFCSHGDIEKYRPLITTIIGEILDSKCKIAEDYQRGPTSRISQSPDTGTHIWIPLKRNPLEIIWDIFHEFGHFKTDQMPDHNLHIKERLPREIAAWQWAGKEIRKYFSTEEDLLNFEGYKNRCLATYIIAYKKWEEESKKSSS